MKFQIYKNAILVSLSVVTGILHKRSFFKKSVLKRLLILGQVKIPSKYTSFTGGN